MRQLTAAGIHRLVTSAGSLALAVLIFHESWLFGQVIGKLLGAPQQAVRAAGPSRRIHGGGGGAPGGETGDALPRAASA